MCASLSPPAGSSAGTSRKHRVGRVPQRVAVFAVQGGGDVPDIVALVAVGRKGHGLAAQVEVAQVDAGREDIHLPAGIVDVVLAVHVVTDRAQQVGDGRPVGRTAAVADMQGAGRIGRDELHLDAPPLAVLTQSVVFSGQPGCHRPRHARRRCRGRN